MSETTADTLTEVLTDIYARHGRLVSTDVVEDSKPKDAPLHHLFEWDDTVAGQSYRLVQAEKLIRSARIRFVTNDSEEAKSVRSFVSVRQTIDPTGFGYKPTGEVMADPLSAAILLRECERAIADLRRKYGHLAEFGDLIRRGFGELAS